ncbi:helix-turn-helix domain-containing protein [Mameliella sp. CS4]|uniref:helix-turn-helix domain-containing protein n=1 Tax=Mameliella sp. CS4 TaxID=2862329 RepID=UPI001C5F84DD|nr:helix-turn-helix transcriptional regulator [Mameliella sp. CS4]MBW4985919.1 helix-turn-helix domain-containing protein [Mameliella sp. CS4]
MTKAPYSPTANLLRDAIDATDKTQRELARAAGLPHANVLSMMKTGECKVPISRIPKLSAALGIDTSRFLEIAMQEYHPEIWMTLKEEYSPLLDEAERKLIDIYQTASFAGRIPMTTALLDALHGLFLVAAVSDASVEE